MVSFFKKHKILFYQISIVILFLIALFLRLRPALIRPIIFDESYTVVYLIKFNKIIDIINTDPSVPPLHYLLIKLMSTTSTNLLWLRLPSIIFSIASLFVIYKWISSFSKRAALFVLIFLTFSTFQVHFAWQAYVYSQLFFFSLLSLYFFYQSFYEKKSNWWKLAGFFIFSLAAWFTHYGYIWTLASLFMVIVFSLWKVKFKLKLLAKQQVKTIFIFFLICLCLAAYSPIFLNNFNDALANLWWMDKITVYSFGKRALSLLGLKDQFERNFLDKKIFYVISAILLFLLCIYHLIGKRKIAKRRKDFVFFLVIITVFNLFTPLIFSLIAGQSVFADRSLIIVSMPIFVLFSFTLNDLSKNEIFGLLLPFVLILIFCFYTRKIDRNTRGIIRHEEVSKYYVEWFREQTPLIGENIKIFLFNSSSPYPYIDIYNNDTTLDYYWYGYDGEKALPKYQLITEENFNQFKNNFFYILVMLNTKKIDMNKQTVICEKPIMVFEVEKKHSLNIYKCNEY